MESILLEASVGRMADWGLLALRIAIGFIFIWHGYPKMFKAIMPNMPVGPRGFGMALKMMGIPVSGFLGWVVSILEFFGGMLLILGLFTRYLALLFAISMVVAIWKAKVTPKAPFPKVPFSSQQTTGWEFDFILLASSIALFLAGPGALSIDRLLLR